MLTSSVSVTTSSAEVEATSNPEITFIPESNTSSEAEPLEDAQDKLEQEGLGGSTEVFLSSDQNITESNQEGSEGRDVREENLDSDEGSGESGDSPEVKPEKLLTNPTLSTDHISEGIDGEPETAAPLPLDIKITLIPHLTLTPGWEPESSSSTPQESRADREFSAEPPVQEESDDGLLKEQEVVVEVNTSSIHGKFKGVLHQKTNQTLTNTLGLF